jgi:hypothetical protein
LDNTIWTLGITGHTVSIGLPGYTQGLSEMHAASIKTISLKWGISGDESKYGLCKAFDRIVEKNLMKLPQTTKCRKAGPRLEECFLSALIGGGELYSDGMNVKIMCHVSSPRFRR